MRTIILLITLLCLSSSAEGGKWVKAQGGKKQPFVYFDPKNPSKTTYTLTNPARSSFIRINGTVIRLTNAQRLSGTVRIRFVRKK